MTIAYSGDSITFPDTSVQNTAPKVGMVNRIINGAMVIDQRNAGASVTNIVGVIFPVDRFNCYGDQASKFSGQRSSIAPTGFVNSLVITSLAAYSVPAGEIFVARQVIEGFNVADLGWGTALASTVTLSFWVRSSLTGTFGGSVQNSAQNRAYPFTYIISAANTWEQKTVIIPGDTSGSWLSTNGVGLTVNLGLGVGTTYSGTAGAWAGAAYYGATGATSVVGTAGATFYITGVQLEKGSTATSFDYRPYGTELALCQRYYSKSFDVAVAPTDAVAGTDTIFAPYDVNSGQAAAIFFPTNMRATPTIIFYRTSGKGITNGQWATYDGAAWVSFTLTASNANSLNFTVVGTRASAFTAKQALLVSGNYTVAAEL